MLTYERTDDYVLTLSDAGRARLAAEQRDLNRDQQRADIFMWSTAGSVVTIAALVITHLLGS